MLYLVLNYWLYRNDEEIVNYTKIEKEIHINAKYNHNIHHKFTECGQVGDCLLYAADK